MKTDLPERTFAFSVRIVNVCQKLDEISNCARTLSRQLIRSGTSIGANVEEGQGSQSRADFVSKMSIACKEARETLYWLRLLVEAKLMSPRQLIALIQECSELIAILTTIVKKTRKPG